MRNGPAGVDMNLVDLDRAWVKDLVSEVGVTAEDSEAGQETETMPGGHE